MKKKTILLKKKRSQQGHGQNQNSLERKYGTQTMGPLRELSKIYGTLLWGVRKIVNRQSHLELGFLFVKHADKNLQIFNQ